MNIPPEVKFLIEKIKERTGIKEQHASHYFVTIDGVDYTVRTKTVELDPITITTDEKKVGFGGYIVPTGAGPVAFQGEILEDENGTTHTHMEELAARVFNDDKTGNLPYNSSHGIGYVIDLVVGFYNTKGIETRSKKYEMFITSEKIGLAFEESGALWLPVEFTQFFY